MTTITSRRGHHARGYRIGQRIGIAALAVASLAGYVLTVAGIR